MKILAAGPGDNFPGPVSFQGCVLLLAVRTLLMPVEKNPTNLELAALLDSPAGVNR